MAVTGQTQASGKTTTLEALIQRSGTTSLTFVTKRGEASFVTGRRIQPYFRDRADWQFVTSLIDATLQEKNKFLRPWIIKICRTTETLADVQRCVRDALTTAKGINAGVYTQLDAYLDLIVPEIERADLAETLDLEPGLNVMDVSSFATPMQMLFIQSALDWINECCSHTTVVIPEAWEFLPQSKSSPVKASAETLIRKGAGIGNHIWLDSQDMAGVDNLALRACTVWLIGVQREANEVKRALANIPANLERPTAADVATLEKGQFYACFGKHVIKTYVQPSWMPADAAREIAMGTLTLEQAGAPPAPPKPEEEPMSKAVEEKLDKLIGLITDLVKAGFQAGVSTQRSIDKMPIEETPSTAAAPVADEEALYQRFKKRLLAEAPAILKILVAVPEINIEQTLETIQTSITDHRGMVAKLIAEGFLDDAKPANQVWKETKRRWNYSGASTRTYEQCDWLTTKGFLTKEADGYRAVPLMKSHIKTV